MIYSICFFVILIHTILFINWAINNYLLLLLEEESFEAVDLNLFVSWSLQTFIILLFIGLLDYLIDKFKILLQLF